MDSSIKVYKHQINLSIVQKANMIEYLSKHPKLNRDSFDSTFTFDKAENMWKTLAKILNNLPGPKKNAHEWRKTWIAIKMFTKLRIRRDESSTFVSTGITTTNSDITAKLNNLEDKVVELLTEEMPINKDYFPVDSSNNTLNTDCDTNLKTAQILESTLNKLTANSLTERDIEIERNYYQKKLVLLERRTRAGEILVDALSKSSAFREMESTLILTKICDLLNF